MALTLIEGVKVLSQASVNLCEEYEKDADLSKEDIFEVVKKAIDDLLKEYAD